MQGNCIQGYIDIQLLAAAIEKAGSTKSLDVSKALEGLSIDSPVGKLTMGTDHQLRRGMIWGYTKFTDQYPFTVLDQIKYVPFEEVIKNP